MISRKSEGRITAAYADVISTNLLITSKIMQMQIYRFFTRSKRTGYTKKRVDRTSAHPLP